LQIKSNTKIQFLIGECRYVRYKSALPLLLRHKVSNNVMLVSLRTFNC